MNGENERQQLHRDDDLWQMAGQAISRDPETTWTEAQDDEHMGHAMAEASPGVSAVPWEVNSLDRATWAIRKIAQGLRGIAERAIFVANERRRLESWQADENARVQKAVDWFSGKLHGYYLAQQAVGALGRSKTLRLPGGRLQLTETGGGWKIDNTDDLLIWAQMNTGPEVPLTRQSETPAWTVIKAGLVKDAAEPIWAQNGEIVPGVVWAPTEKKFRVTIDQAEDSRDTARPETQGLQVEQEG